MAGCLVSRLWYSLSSRPRGRSEPFSFPFCKEDRIITRFTLTAQGGGDGPPVMEHLPSVLTLFPVLSFSKWPERKGGRWDISTPKPLSLWLSFGHHDGYQSKLRLGRSATPFWLFILRQGLMYSGQHQTWYIIEDDLTLLSSGLYLSKADITSRNHCTQVEAALKPTLFQSEVRNERKMGNARELKWEMMRPEPKERERENSVKIYH